LKRATPKDYTEISARSQAGLLLIPVEGQELLISKIYAGDWPFVAGSIQVVITLFVAPALTTWLPEVLL
jgi:TRAP-type mannitol/chloroaromatic compound transport system permease large subunit